MEKQTKIKVLIRDTKLKIEDTRLKIQILLEKEKVLKEVLNTIEIIDENKDYV